ncbi:Hint domain-containing protein [Litoreibacter halocynthiae]|uniref:Hint domain-containing protein n=1 Tax=Litoreibacter halocynthiae TaxID=1242689 RepID=UPI00248F7617|nr:Hint domain-containing protein [Litoreibacter halocynthiae]
MAALTANTSASAVAMASEILGAGFTINSATYSGATGSSAIYTNGDTTNPGVLPSDTGVILSTGNVSTFANASGANNTGGGTTTDTAGINGNAAFNAAAGQSTFDASFLEINLTPEPGQTSINIEFRFYSEEYNEYVYSNFNDIALVQLNGVTQPISVGSGEISVNGINDAATYNPSNGNQNNDPNPGNGQFDSANPNLYVNNSGGAYATEMDGFTVTLSLDIPVTPGVAQTLMIGIADVGDSSYDSAIVIASNNVPGATDTDPIATDDTGIETWGSNPKTVDILANDTDPTSQALTITQINGVNVVSGQTVTLPSGQAITLNPNGTIMLVNTGGQTGLTSFSYTVADTDGNTDSAFVTFDASPICYCDGTLIETPNGPRAVETLRSGDLVLTRDEGPQPIRWIGSRDMYASSRHAPIEIAAGVMENRLPLRVSPQHRILRAGSLAQLYFGQEEVLVAARHLVDGINVRQLASGRVSYYHLMFDRHQIITANGIASESYQPGDFSLPGLHDAAREEMFAVFPELRSNPAQYGQSARQSISGTLAHVLAA